MSRMRQVRLLVLAVASLFCGSILIQRYFSELPKLEDPGRISGVLQLDFEKSKAARSSPTTGWSSDYSVEYRLQADFDGSPSMLVARGVVAASPEDLRPRALVRRSALVNTHELRPGRFVLSALLAIAVVTPLGLTAQRWMTYELLGGEGGLGAWGGTPTILAGVGLATARKRPAESTTRPTIAASEPPPRS